MTASIPTADYRPAAAEDLMAEIDSFEHEKTIVDDVDANPVVIGLWRSAADVDVSDLDLYVDDEI